MSDDCCDLLADEAERRFGIEGFRALWAGRRPLATELGATDALIRRLVRAGRLEVDADRRLVGIHGLVARPTSHRIEHHGRRIHTWCALDAIGIPAALGIDATTVTHCPSCGSEQRITFNRGVPDGDDRTRLWLPGMPCAHVIDDFCAHSNLYCSVEHLHSTITAESSGQVFTIDGAAELGRSTWSEAAAARADDRHDTT